MRIKKRSLALPFRELMKHQVKGFEYLEKMWDKRKGGALLMEMRLGKTLLLIRFLKSREISKPILIIAPISVCKTWQNELYAEGESGVLMLSTQGRDEKRDALASLRGVKWVITNYDTLLPYVRYEELYDELGEPIMVEDRKKGLIHKRIKHVGETTGFENVDWGAVVTDETLKFASPNAELTKWLLKNFEHVKRKYILNGNAAPEGVHQYFTQMMFVLGHFLGKYTFWSFRSAYFEKRGYEWVPQKGVVQKIYDAVHRSAFVLSRKEAGIGSKKIYDTRYVPMTKAQAKAYQQMDTEFEADEVTTNYIVTKFLYLRRLATGQKLKKKEDDKPYEWHSVAKLKEVIHLVQSDFRDEQVLVWFSLRDTLSKMEEMLSKEGISFCSAHGGLTSDERELARSEFLDGKYQVGLLTIQAEAKGKDWSSASTSIYVENVYSNDLRSQSEDRVVHPKKKEPVLLLDIMTENTIEEDIRDAVLEKGAKSRFLQSKLWGRLRGVIDVENFKEN